MSSLQIIYQPITALKPYSNNPRTHSQKQIAQIANSIQHFGFTNPILVDNNNGIIAGHGRLSAAKQLNITEVPTVELSSMTEAQKRAYIITDNRLAETAGWDNNLLAIEFEALVELDFDINLTGFETPQVDFILQSHGSELDEGDGIETKTDDQPIISQPGDLWLLGTHKLLCADATQAENYEHLLDGALADMIFTDPPYNVPIKGHVSGKGKSQHAEFVMASGEMSEAEFTQFLNTICNQLCQHSVDGSLHYLCMDWRHMYELLQATRSHYSELKNLCVWNKDNGGMGSLYRSKHELVFVLKNGHAPHINNVELGRHGRNRTNVWDYPSANSWKTDPDESLAIHPTVKPVDLVCDAILDASKRGANILDPFIGSGTTLLAAHKTGRRAFGMELDPGYVDLVIRRYQKLTDECATLSHTGQTFFEIEQQRAEKAAEVLS